MKWFWRMVCAPDCTDACQVNCPGCHTMADEWREQGYQTPATTGDARPGRWRDFRYAVSCWSRSASARMLVRLDPRRIVRRGAAPALATAGGGCGCHVDQPSAANQPGAGGIPGGIPGALGGLPVATDAGIRLSAAASGLAPASGPGDQIRGAVRDYYGQRARRVPEGSGTDPSGVPTVGLLPVEVSPVPSYQPQDLAAVPADAIQASLGCGNPFDRAALQSGEVVLDLGSGGGMDALVASRRVGTDGHVFGLDMSDDMIALAQRNATAAGVTNVAFLKGDMESVPLPRGSVDVIISNCVVNLVPDKARALREAIRVLRPEGRLSISDIVTRRPVPEHLKGDLSAWAACVGGALSEDEYRAELVAAGFVDIEIAREREFTAADADVAGLTPVLARAGLGEALELGFANTSVRARKPLPEPVGHPPVIRVPAAALSD